MGPAGDLRHVPDGDADAGPATSRAIPRSNREVRRYGMSKTPDFDRRRFVGVTAATVAAGPLGLLGRVNAMTHAVTDVAQPKGRAGTEIRQFSFKASDADLADLRRRINASKWPEREWVPDSSDGVPLRTMQNLA